MLGCLNTWMLGMQSDVMLHTRPIHPGRAASKSILPGLLVSWSLGLGGSDAATWCSGLVRSSHRSVRATSQQQPIVHSTYCVIVSCTVHASCSAAVRTSNLARELTAEEMEASRVECKVVEQMFWVNGPCRALTLD